MTGDISHWQFNLTQIPAVPPASATVATLHPLFYHRQFTTSGYTSLSMDRRKFLKEFTAALVGLAGIKGLWIMADNAKSSLSLVAQALYTCKEYKGTDFAGWEVALGDAIYACEGEPPVTINDIKSVHEQGHSEVQANIRRRCIMAHNITFKRVITDRAFDYIHCAYYEFRLPFLPSPDVNDEENAQTIEGGLFVWDGKGTRFDYGMGYQVMLNPWSNFGELRIWSTDESSDGQWVAVGQLDPDTEWHSVAMTVDFQTGSASLTIDDTEYPAKYTKTNKPDVWAKETAARIQAEIVSVWPEPAGIKASHRAQFRDWNWAWKKNESCDTYLPVVMK